MRSSSSPARLTFDDLRRGVSSVAAALRDRFGVGPGARVGLIAANSPEWILTYLAVTSLGGVVVAFNGWWTGAEIAYGVELTDPQLLVVDRRRAERMAGYHVPTVPTLVIDDEFAGLEQHDPSAELPSVDIDPDDPAAVLFTSGTTGRPKGAIQSHRGLLMLVTSTAFTATRTVAERPQTALRDEPTTLVQLPLFHVSGLQAVYHTLGLGLRTVWPVGRFDEEQVLQFTERYRVTAWSLMATQIWRILEHEAFERYELDSLSFVGGGGSTWAPELIRLVHSRLPRAAAAMTFGFGQTETGGMGTVNAGPTVTAYPDSVGRPRPTVEIEIRDLDGAPVDEGVEGDIFLRGPFVFLGYWDDPDATAATIQPDGWMRTGDIGRVEDGLLYLSSRRTDLIIRGGENVYPAEIENRLVEHPAVFECAVYGVDHRLLGQQVKAVVVRRPGTEAPTPDELAAWVGQTLAPFKVPEHFEVRDEPLPRTATGKVMKHVVSGTAESSFVEE